MCICTHIHIHTLTHTHLLRYTDRTAWSAFNATIKDFPVNFKFPGNWNPAPVALPDGRVRIMVHTGFSGFYNSTDPKVGCP